MNAISTGSSRPDPTPPHAAPPDAQQRLRRELARERARLERKHGLSGTGPVVHYTRPVERPFLRHQRDRTTILFGGLTATHEALVEGLMAGLGYHVQALPAPDLACLQIGKEYGNNGQCNPSYFTVGSLLEHLRRLRDQQGMTPDQIRRRYVYLTAGACGPCRFGMYEAEFRLALRNAGFDGFRVVLFQQKDGLHQSDAEAGLCLDQEFFLGLMNALVLADWLHATAYRTRPYECHPGDTARVVEACVGDLRDVLRRKPSLPLRDAGLGRLVQLCPGLDRAATYVRRYLDQLLSDHYVNAMRRVADRLDRIPCDPLRVKPVVKITGEFWAQTTEGDGNFHMHRFLEQEGAEVLPEPVITWVDYLLYQNRQGLREACDPGRSPRARDPWRRRWVAAWRRMATSPIRSLRTWAASWLLRRECERLRRPVRHAVPRPPDQTELEHLAHPFYDSRLRGGEGHLEVGKSIYYTLHRRCHMVLSLKPFGCMPSTQSDGVQAAVVSRYPDILFLPVETSGEGQIHAYSRVQMALGDARQAARQEFETALRQTGYALSQIERYIDQHPALGRPLAPVPHLPGVVGRAANLVWHVARSMHAEGVRPRRATIVCSAPHTPCAACAAGHLVRSGDAS